MPHIGSWFVKWKGNSVNVIGRPKKTRKMFFACPYVFFETTASKRQILFCENKTYSLQLIIILFYFSQPKNLQNYGITFHTILINIANKIIVMIIAKSACCNQS